MGKMREKPMKTLGERNLAVKMKTLGVDLPWGNLREARRQFAKPFSGNLYR
jgi:hypothetical protein